MKIRVNNAFRSKATAFALAVRECSSCDLIILVETYFRPPLFRVAEYILFGFLRLVRSERRRTLTLGVNQLRVVHWEAYLQGQNLSGGYLDIIRACENVSRARAATNWYLDLRRPESEDSTPLSQIYTGRRNAYYDELLSHAFCLVHNLKTSPRTTHRNRPSITRRPQPTSRRLNTQ
jgi:hypothetical protein